MVALGGQGRLTGDQLAAGLERARAKIDELKPGINSLGEALRQFGLKTQTELQAVADNLGDAYTQISNSTTVSLADQRKAFDQWAAAAIAAHGGVETAAVALQRSILETREALAGAGDAGEDAGQRTGRAFRDAARDIGDATAAASPFSAAAQRARNASDLSTQKSSFGDGFSTTGQLQLGEGETFDQAAFNRDQNAYMQGGGGRTAPDPNNPRYRSGGGVSTDDFVPVGGSVAPWSPFKAPAPAPAAAPAPVPPTATPNGTSTTHTVKLELNGKRTTVNAATAADASTLAAWLRDLETAAARA